MITSDFRHNLRINLQGEIHHRPEEAVHTGPEYGSFRRLLIQLAISVYEVYIRMNLHTDLIHLANQMQINGICCPKILRDSRFTRAMVLADLRLDRSSPGADGLW